jgi:hypothetical protein
LAVIVLTTQGQDADFFDGGLSVEAHLISPKFGGTVCPTD